MTTTNICYWSEAAFAAFFIAGLQIVEPGLARIWVVNCGAVTLRSALDRLFIRFVRRILLEEVGNVHDN
jgi:hypothetical protein